MLVVLMVLLMVLMRVVTGDVGVGVAVAGHAFGVDVFLVDVHGCA